MTNKTLKDFVQKDSLGAWAGSVQVMLDEMSVDVRNLKQQNGFRLAEIRRLQEASRIPDEIVKKLDERAKKEKGCCLKCLADAENWMSKDWEHTCNGKKSCGKCELQGSSTYDDPLFDHSHGCEKKEEKKEERWRPEHMQMHYFIGEDGSVTEERFDSNTACYQDVWKFGNSFPTREAAEHASCEIKKLLKSLQQ